MIQGAVQLPIKFFCNLPFCPVKIFTGSLYIPVYGSTVKGVIDSGPLPCGSFFSKLKPLGFNNRQFIRCEVLV